MRQQYIKLISHLVFVFRFYLQAFTFLLQNTARACSSITERNTHKVSHVVHSKVWSVEKKMTLYSISISQSRYIANWIQSTSRWLKRTECLPHRDIRHVSVRCMISVHTKRKRRFLSWFTFYETGGCRFCPVVFSPLIRLCAKRKTPTYNNKRHSTENGKTRRHSEFNSARQNKCMRILRAGTNFNFFVRFSKQRTRIIKDIRSSVFTVHIDILPQTFLS